MGKKCRFYVDIMAMHEEVTGSCNLAIVKFPNGETLRFVTDCGLFQERKYDELNNALPFDPEKVDFCLITHTHVDHIGGLPYMVKKGFYRSIYVTETTNKLLPLALNDSFKVLSSVSKRNFDGKLAIRYTNLYIKDGLGIKPEMKDFLPQNLTFVDNESRSDVLKSTSKKIIVTTSGMGSYGPAQVYIPEYISRSNTLIHFTGYTAEGTMGGKLKNAETGSMVEVGGLIAKKRANVEYTTEYSAHAKADEMIEFLKQFKNLKLVLVNHGESQTKNIFAERIVEEVDAKRVGLLGREYFFRIDSYGLVKTLSTKFQ